MKNPKELFHLVEKFTTDNSPALLTAVGVVGTLSTAVLSAKAHVKATDRLRAADIQNAEDNLVHKDLGPLTRQDKAKLVWKLYVPPLAMAAITTSAVIGANRIGTRRAAALAAAYAGSDKAFTEYKDKVAEMLGDKEEAKVREAVDADRIKKNPLSDEALAASPEDKDWFYDAMHGRYFQSTMEDVKAAQNHCNYLLNQDGDVSLNTFYSWLGVDTVPAGEELGWRRDKGLIEVMFTYHGMSNGRPATVMNFRLEPIRHTR